MKVRKIPMRTCVVSKEKCEKQNLIRVVKTKEGTVVVDLTGKMNGRGAYLKKDLAIFEKAKKTKILEKTLEVNIEDDFYETLNELVK